MHDYFSEFLLQKNPIGAFASWLGDGTNPTSSSSAVFSVNQNTDVVSTGASSCGSNIKIHLIWAVVTIATVYVTFKISKWYAGYEIAKRQNPSNTPSTLLASA